MGRKQPAPQPGSQEEQLRALRRECNELLRDLRAAIKEAKEERQKTRDWIYEGIREYIGKAAGQLVAEASAEIAEGMKETKRYVTARCMNIQEMMLGKADNRINAELTAAIYRAMVRSGVINEIITAEGVVSDAKPTKITDIEDALTRMFE